MKNTIAEQPDKSADGRSENEDEAKTKKPGRKYADDEKPDTSLHQSLSLWFYHDGASITGCG